ncbi:hypothetical protein GQ42DRAFT_161409 [Ramicandelaber brevisporus]|nr:hypothetical protein GQ42DRAFT_161409 [Ramicandelaber brevisporus]
MTRAMTTRFCAVLHQIKAGQSGYSPLLRQQVRGYSRPPVVTYRRFGDPNNGKNQSSSAFGGRLNQRTMYIIGGAGLSFGAYYVSHLEPAPVTGRLRFMNVSREAEKAAGDQAYRALLQKYSNQLYPDNHPISQYVRKVANRIIEVASSEMPTDTDWRVHVIHSDEPNAFVLPGGRIFVFSGILPIAQNEAGLASVLGHEVAHQVARHSAEKMSLDSISGIFLLLLSVFIDPSFYQTNRMLMELGVMLPNSRACETEADMIGLNLMAKACYPPAETVQLWTRMQQKAKDAPFQFISTHPSHGNRIKTISEKVPDAEAIRNEVCSAGTIDMVQDMFSSYRSF